MIAVCLVCKSIFEDRGITIKCSTNVTLSNNSTTCPKCGSRAKYLDGTFNFDSNAVATVLSAPQFTVDILRIVKDLIEKAQNGRITPEEFHQEINKLPGLASNILKLIVPKEPSGFWAMIGVMILVINILLGPKEGQVPKIEYGGSKPKIELIEPLEQDSVISKEKIPESKVIKIKEDKE